MTYQDAIGDLARLWDLLPALAGPSWGELEPPLLDALDRLAAARTDDEYELLAARVLRLCLRHEPLRRALEAAIRRDDSRGEQAELPGWPVTADELATVVERSSRPGGEQWLAARVADHPDGAPVRAGREFVLTIGVEAGQPPAALAAEPVPGWARPDGDGAVLTVDLRGDADIRTVSPVLTLPREGPSADQARFRVTPRPGREWLTLTAVVMRDRMFVQVLTLIVPVEAGSGPSGGVRVRARGRPVSRAFSGAPDATLVLAGGQLRLTGPYEASAELPFGELQLGQIADRARAALEEIAWSVPDDSAAHQDGVEISAESYQASLAALLRAGQIMFSTLFFGPAASPELGDLGRALARLAALGEPLWLEIASEPPLIPWHLLAFPGPDPGGTGPAHLLGLRHRITYYPMPASASPPRPSPNLRPDDGPFRVVLAVNRDIDQRDGTRRDLVASQLADWQLRAGGAGGALTVTEAQGQDILDALARNKLPAELIYAFCHARREDTEPDRLGQLAARLQFTGGHEVSLDDLILTLPSSARLDTAPLVVLNACASAVPGSSVYGSFLPYLLGRGARGVIGTEADVPPVLAAAWATGFFDRVLDGVPLADAAFGVTRDLAVRCRNLLGLLYALHCEGESRIRPAIPPGP